MDKKAIHQIDPPICPANHTLCQQCWEIKREVIPNLVQKINSALLCVV